MTRDGFRLGIARHATRPQGKTQNALALVVLLSLRFYTSLRLGVILIHSKQAVSRKDAKTQTMAKAKQRYLGARMFCDELGLALA